jgi:hypothetical protein
MERIIGGYDNSPTAPRALMCAVLDAKRPDAERVSRGTATTSGTS